MYPFSYFLGQKNKYNYGGAEEARTPNLFAASEMLYQLSYSPNSLQLFNKSFFHLFRKPFTLCFHLVSNISKFSCWILRTRYSYFCFTQIIYFSFFPISNSSFTILNFRFNKLCQKLCQFF